MQKTEALFEITVPGKWILAGEHSVLRGSEALVFPLQSKFLNLKYFKTESELELLISGQNKSDLELIIWSVLEKAFKLLNIKRSQITGTLVIDSHIALGGGVGASATLCVALTEWLSKLGHIKETELFNFARELENLFHGESSGVDVAVTLAKQPLIFTRHNGYSELKINLNPKFYLSYSGERGVTKDCIEKVKNLFLTDPQLAQSLDAQMDKSVGLFKELFAKDSDIQSWIAAMNLSNNCFEKWGLITDSVSKHQKILRKHGALAVKLTGSGGGGYVLSLWTSSPSKQLPFEMIACFE